MCVCVAVTCARSPCWTSGESPRPQAARAIHQWQLLGETTGEPGPFGGPNNNMTGRPGGQEAQRDRPMLRKALLKESKWKKKMTSSISALTNPWLSGQFNVVIAQNNNNSGELMILMNQSQDEDVLLSVPTVKNPAVRFDWTTGKDLFLKLGMCSLPGIYWATASMYLRFHLRQFHCFCSFWVHKKVKRHLGSRNQWGSVVRKFYVIFGLNYNKLW